MYERTDIAALVIRIEGRANNDLDPEVRMKMRIVSEIIRFMDYSTPEWRQRLITELNERNLEPLDGSEAEAALVNIIINNPKIDLDIKNYLSR
jgi:hypothetical protein